eukprot:338819-Chlamydomonas_euryale.AAC.2
MDHPKSAHLWTPSRALIYGPLLKRSPMDPFESSHHACRFELAGAPAVLRTWRDHASEADTSVGVSRHDTLICHVNPSPPPLDLQASLRCCLERFLTPPEIRNNRAPLPPSLPNPKDEKQKGASPPLLAQPQKSETKGRNSPPSLPNPTAPGPPHPASPPKP